MEPARIGKYTTHERIGRGSLSDVFKAFDANLNRYVALKTISRGLLLNEDVRKRFYREAQAAAALNHPNIITVHELGEDGGMIFIAMELLEGSNLRDLIDAKTEWSLDQKLDIMVQIAEGTGFAHSDGVIHRDLKPTNIHIQPDGRVIITDFSVATLVTSDSTRSGMVVITPNYMSPEQLRDESIALSSDVFSLGAIFYELLSFVKPFAADAFHTTLLKVLRGDRQPFSEIAPDVPESFVRIMDKALALAPDERYETGNDFLHALRDARGVDRFSAATTTSPAEPEKATVTPVAPPAEPEPARVADEPPLPQGLEAPIPTRSLAGSLKSVHIADLLQWCSINVKTGTLQLRHGPVEKRLYFRDGILFSSSSNSPREVLGQFLIRSGHISEEDLFGALLEQERTKEPLGWILMSKDLLGKGDLQKLLRLQCEESIYDCFLWSDGEFAFDDHQIPEKVPVSFYLDISHVIQDGIDRMDKWENIRRQFSSRLTTFAVNKDVVDARAEERTDEEQRILELVVRGKNLSEVALELHAVDYYAASQLLQLCEDGFIKVDLVPQESHYDTQIQELRDRLAQSLELFNEDQHQKILENFDAALEAGSDSASASVDELSNLIEEAEKIKTVPREGIPKIKVPLEELANLSLAPQEGFVLSRMGGDWDIRSILKICPLSELEALKIIKGLIDRGIIEIQPA
jgi:serine/threonine protein kinase